MAENEGGSFQFIDSVLGRLPVLKREKNPNIAALLGFLLGGIGLGLYFWSFIDFVVPVVFTIILAVAFQSFGQFGWMGGAVVAAVYGYLRAVNSNSKLALTLAREAKQQVAEERPNNYGMRSPDGRWWWNGSEWKPAGSEAPPKPD